MLLLLALGMFYLDSMRDAVNSATRNVTTRAARKRRPLGRDSGTQRRSRDRQAIRGTRKSRRRSQSGGRHPIRRGTQLVRPHGVAKLVGSSKARADQSQRQLGLNRDGSWYLTDHLGFQRWREPLDEKTFDKNFSYRDYFHGLGEQFEEGTTPPNIQPITKPHVSLSYKSQATGLNMVSLTAPVWDDKHERVIGVLGRSMELAQLLSPYVPGRHRDAEADEEADSSRRIVLIDDRNWQLLDHPWISDEHRDDPTKDVPSLRLSDETIARLRFPRQHPASRRRFQSSFKCEITSIRSDNSARTNTAANGSPRSVELATPAGSRSFKSRKSAVLRPVDAMAARLRRDGAWALVLSGVLIGTLWLVVLRGLKERSERTPLPSAPDRSPEIDG